MIRNYLKNIYLFYCLIKPFFQVDMNLKEIEAEAFEKEKLWQSAASVHIKSLQEALNVKTQLYDELHKNFSQLKEDFKYNLKVHSRTFT